MSDNSTTKIKKGLDIRVKGAAEHYTVETFSSKRYAVKPTDYVGVTPKLLVKEGDQVKAGTTLFYDKNNEQARFTSPVSGVVEAVVRGAKRALLQVVVAADEQNAAEKFTVGDVNTLSRDQIVETLVQSGAWTLLRRRPFGIIPTVDDTPKAIFISGFDTAPLAADVDYTLHGRQEEWQKGIDVLHRLVSTIHLSINPEMNKAGIVENTKNVVLHRFSGKHPAGLVGTQINKISPINKGESVWTIKPQDVCTIGRLFATGEYCPEQVIAMVGPAVKNPQYHRVLAGESIADMVDNVTEENVRYISGNMLTGVQIAKDGFLSASQTELTVLLEGDHYDFMGWLLPGFKKYSASHTFLSGFLQCKCSKKILEKMEMNTNTHGDERPYMVTGQFEKVFPLDIYPLQLIKACVIGDIELMEDLGIYEVEPEDFALCEFVDTSKTEIQSAIRAGLENCRLN